MNTYLITWEKISPETKKVISIEEVETHEAEKVIAEELATVEKNGFMKRTTEHGDKPPVLVGEEMPLHIDPFDWDLA